MKSIRTSDEDRAARAEAVGELWRRTRRRTVDLVTGLPPEDLVIQSMEDASPAKWHLAHTTWFFETFVLTPFAAHYESPDPRFAFLFNSYYVQAGPRFERGQRGLISRPTVAEVMAYRQAVDDAIRTRLDYGGFPPEAIDRIELGCHHEMQHQELLLTDLLHAYSFNPLRPTYRAPEPLPVLPFYDTNGWLNFEGGIVEIGHPPKAGFAFDNEGPRHEVLLQPYRLAGRPVTARDWLSFIEDGGYRTPTLWLADGWAAAQRLGWTAPGYWWREESRWWSMTLRGPQPVELDAPVTHVSFYEADAFARYAGKRLPTEAEWEVASARCPPKDGNFLESGHLRPRSTHPDGPRLAQMWGDVWEWTASPYMAYPGFRPASGAIGEYNGKFMCNQVVLKGGSCVTPAAQIRPSYRTFFYPHQRWQFMGLRLAEDDL